MVMALDWGTGGREFKPRRFQNISDLSRTVGRNGLTEETRNGLTEQFGEWFDGRASH